MCSFRKSSHRNFQDCHVEGFLTSVFLTMYIISFQNFVAKPFTELNRQLKHCLCWRLIYIFWDRGSSTWKDCFTFLIVGFVVVSTELVEKTVGWKKKTKRDLEKFLILLPIKEQKTGGQKKLTNIIAPRIVTYTFLFKHRTCFIFSFI